MYKIEKGFINTCWIISLLFVSLVMTMPFLCWRRTSNEIISMFGGFLMAINNTLMMVQLGYPTGVLGGS